MSAVTCESHSRKAHLDYLFRNGTRGSLSKLACECAWGSLNNPIKERMNEKKKLYWVIKILFLFVFDPTRVTSENK